MGAGLVCVVLRRSDVPPCSHGCPPHPTQPPATSRACPAHSAHASLSLFRLPRCAGWHAPIEQLLADTQPEDVTGYPAYDRPPIIALRRADPAGPAEGRGDGAADAGASRPSGSSLGASGTAEDGDGQARIAPSTRVTLIGDAAHPMSPFKGQGANQALLDAVALARALRSHEVRGEQRLPLAAALRTFEEEMLARSRAKVLASHEAVELLHSPTATVRSNSTRARSAKEGRQHEGGGSAEGSGSEGSSGPEQDQLAAFEVIEGAEAGAQEDERRRGEGGAGRERSV